MKMAESKVMQELMVTRTAKEEAEIELLEQRKKQEAELHTQRMSHDRELHIAKLFELGVDLDDLRSRCRGPDAQTQTDSDL